jgi:hypothetical protein
MHRPTLGFATLAAALLAMLTITLPTGVAPFDAASEAVAAGNSPARATSRSTVRRPRSGSIRSTRARPARPTSAAAANINARIQRVVPRDQAPLRQRPGAQSPTRPRSASGSVRTAAPGATARRASVSSLTSSYRPPNPTGEAPITRAELNQLSARLERMEQALYSNATSINSRLTLTSFVADTALQNSIINRALATQRP